ncbi:MAG: hypothetical protein NT132_03880 [Microbacterium sp.]|uniref:hypothetical protein n=1 Tax=Microbacterium sp. TaxID=51671 RepID=UPI0026266709|nr:hypothetical protein [Microbacterium sp.]MCX6501538.1 hypothetical protein [Microbacterium sp.]
MTATQIADAFESAIRTGDMASMRPLLHPRVQASSFDQSSYSGVDDVLTWVSDLLADKHAQVSVTERYVDEPVAVLVLLRAKDGIRIAEYTVALITLDGALIRIVVDV